MFLGSSKGSRFVERDSSSLIMVPNKVHQGLKRFSTFLKKNKIKQARHTQKPTPPSGLLTGFLERFLGS